jgi:hypothetical protein
MRKILPFVLSVFVLGLFLFVPAVSSLQAATPTVNVWFEHYLTEYNLSTLGIYLKPYNLSQQITYFEVDLGTNADLVYGTDLNLNQTRSSQDWSCTRFDNLFRCEGGATAVKLQLNLKTILTIFLNNQITPPQELSIKLSYSDNSSETKLAPITENAVEPKVVVEEIAVPPPPAEEIEVVSEPVNKPVEEVKEEPDVVAVKRTTKTERVGGEKSIVAEDAQSLTQPETTSLAAGSDNTKEPAELTLNVNTSPPIPAGAEAVKSGPSQPSFFASILAQAKALNQTYLLLAILFVAGLGTTIFLAKTGKIGKKVTMISAIILILGLGGSLYGLFTCCQKCGNAWVGTVRCVATIGAKTTGYGFGESAAEKEGVEMVKLLKLPFMTADILFDPRCLLMVKLLSEIFLHQPIPTEPEEIYQLPVDSFEEILQAFRDFFEKRTQLNYGVELFAIYEIQQCQRDSEFFWDNCYWKTITTLPPIRIIPPQKFTHPATPSDEFKGQDIQAWVPRVLYTNDPNEANEVAQYLAEQLKKLAPPECRVHIEALQEEEFQATKWVDQEMKKEEEKKQ